MDEEKKTDVQEQDAKTCCPGCSCGTTGDGSRTKWAICSLVALAVVVVAAAHVSRIRTADRQVGPRGYAMSIPATTEQAAPAAELDAWAAPLKALADLNVVATNTDGVFIVLPSGDTKRMATIRKEVAVAASTITARGTKIGTFLLSQDSQEYATAAQQVGIPAVLAICKGRGMAAVPDKEITQNNLLKAFVGASRPLSSACCPGGAGGSTCQ